MFQALSAGKTEQLPIMGELPPPPGGVVGVAVGALVGVLVGATVGVFVGVVVGVFVGAAAVDVRVGVAARPLQEATTSFVFTRVIESFVPSHVTRSASPGWIVVPVLVANAAKAPNPRRPAMEIAAGNSERFTGNRLGSKVACNYGAISEQGEGGPVEKKGRPGCEP